MRIILGYWYAIQFVLTFINYHTMVKCVPFILSCSHICSTKICLRSDYENLNAELLAPTAEEIRNLVQKAYDAGCIRGREEAKRALQGFVGSPNGGGSEAGEARIAGPR